MKDLMLQDAKILIVDDQDGNVLFLEGLLQEGGYRCWRSLRDSRQAAAVCAEFRPDLILLDLLMPDLDGFGVLEQIAPYMAGQVYLPVLILTVDITPESKRRALAAGAKDFLAKPLDAVEVLLRVKNLLETRFLYLQLQQHADDRIREQAALIDQANDAILVCDLVDRIKFWSRGAEAVYGWTVAEVVGRSVPEVLFPATAQDLRKVNRALTASGKWAGELPQVTRDGQDILVASRWTLLRNADGQPKSKLIINTDITEAKKTEDKLLRAQRVENIGRLASGIAHDLNNILTPLTTSVDVLALNSRDASQKELLTIMQASLGRGVELLRQLQTFSRGQTGQRGPMQLGPLIEEVAGLFRRTFPRSITIETAVAEDLWPIFAEPTQMHQVLTNLCVNARDALPQGGNLRITAVNCRLDDSQGDEELAPGNYVVLEVADNGTGIPPDILAKIFEAFFTTKEVGKGTGLGLSTAHGIVKNHGGRIRVHSEVGKGTRFTVLLPACEDLPEDASEPEEPAERPEIAGGRGELILVVDDETAMQHIAKLTLTAAGYRVVTAKNGAVALELYKARSKYIQLVVTDLVMPVMDGAALIQSLRRLNPAVRIVAVSGALSGAETAESLGAAVKSFLPKPYTMETLLSTVRVALDDR